VFLRWFPRLKNWSWLPVFWRATGDIFSSGEHNYFGNTDYTLAFIFISVTVLLKQASGQLVVLQSLRKMRLHESQFLWKLNGVACFNLHIIITE
jgi:hypothetical protein